jgi:hypothetical protein
MRFAWVSMCWRASTSFTKATTTSAATTIVVVVVVVVVLLVCGLFPSKGANASTASPLASFTHHSHGANDNTGSSVVLPNQCITTVSTHENIIYIFGYQNLADFTA